MCHRETGVLMLRTLRTPCTPELAELLCLDKVMMPSQWRMKNRNKFVEHDGKD